MTNLVICASRNKRTTILRGERLASSIGGGGWCSVSPDAISSSLTSHETDLLNEWPKIYNNEYPFEYPHETMPTLTKNEDIFGQTSSDLQYVCPMRHLYTLNMDNKQDILWSVMHDFCYAGSEKFNYYRHSDHLGSANWITDQDGHAVQYLHYLPYGELLLNQQVAGYDERYKFTDKERDAESGYDYFGARYYASPLYNWTSVDPLADQSPQISPYAYCGWNPIKFIDPNGRRAMLSFSHNSITVTANYYAKKEDLSSANKAVQFWNNQKGQYVSANGKVFSVSFNLSVIPSDNPRKDAALSSNDYSNSYEVVSDLGTKTIGSTTYTITGQTRDNYQIEVRDSHKNELTGAHEVGHSLMNLSGTPDVEHSPSGVMTKTGDSPSRGKFVSQETINNIINSNQSLWQKVKSWFE